jgi:hypothetical protein
MISNANDVKTLVLVKTNIGGWFFDAFIRLDHVSKLKITEHPVQTGASITDHAYLEPKELTIEVGMSDAAKSLVSGQFSSDRSRSVTAYKVLRELQDQRIPVQVLTRLGIYQNMMVESISVPDDYMSLYGLKASVVMREILVSTVKTVKISARPQISGSTNRGTVGSVKQNESILYQWGLGR